MWALRKMVDSTAITASCLLALEDSKDTDSISEVVLLAAKNETVHVYQLHQPPLNPAPGVDIATPVGHVYHVGCGIAGLVALAHQCFAIWTHDNEFILVRYQPYPDAAARERDRVMNIPLQYYNSDGEPRPFNHGERHWYTVVRKQVFCPDDCTSLAVTIMGVNECQNMVYVRTCTQHLILFHVKWAPQMELRSISTPRLPVDNQFPPCSESWFNRSVLHVYQGTGFTFPSQSCSVATRRAEESEAHHRARLEELWESRSPFAGVPDEDLITTHSASELAKHKSGFSGNPKDKLDLVVGFSGIIDTAVKAERFPYSSSLQPSPPLWCGDRRGGFTYISHTEGKGYQLLHCSSTMSCTRETALMIEDDNVTELRGLSFAVPLLRVSAQESWMLMVLIAQPGSTTMHYEMFVPRKGSTAKLVRGWTMHDNRSALQALCCHVPGEQEVTLWLLLSDGSLTAVDLTELQTVRRTHSEAEECREEKTCDDATKRGWPAVQIEGLPQSFQCRNIQNAGASYWSRPQRSSLVYPCTGRYALLSDAVQDVYVVDLIERRVTGFLGGYGTMTDICETERGFIVSYSKGIMQRLVMCVPLYMRGFFSLLCTSNCTGGSVEDSIVSLTGATVPTSAVDQFSGASLVVMVSHQHSSRLLLRHADSLEEVRATDCGYLEAQPTLQFLITDDGDVVQCTPTCLAIAGAPVAAFPCPLLHGAVKQLPGFGVICAGATEAGDLVMLTDRGTVALPEMHLSAAASCLATAMWMANERAFVLLLVPDWDCHLTLFTFAADAERKTWTLLSSEQVLAEFEGAALVQRIIPIGETATLSRWLLCHADGTISVVAVAHHDESKAEPKWCRPSVDGGDGDRDLRANDIIPIFHDPTQPPGELDAILLQPDDGVLCLLATAQHEPHDVDSWRAVAYSIKAALLPSEVPTVSPHECRSGVAWAYVSATGELQYDVLLATSKNVMLVSPSRGLFRLCDRSKAGTEPRGFRLNTTIATRCIPVQTRALTLIHPCESIVWLAAEPHRDSNYFSILVVTACRETGVSRVVSVNGVTLAVQDSIEFNDEMVHWAEVMPRCVPAERIPVSSQYAIGTLPTCKDGKPSLTLISSRPLRIITRMFLPPLCGPNTSHLGTLDGAAELIPRRSGESDATWGATAEDVMILLSWQSTIYSFVLRGHTFIAQQVLSFAQQLSSVTFCFPLVSVCSEGPHHVFLQVKPVAECGQNLSTEECSDTSLLEAYGFDGRPSWRLSTFAVEPATGGHVVCQATMLGRFVRSDAEGNVTLVHSAPAPPWVKSGPTPSVGLKQGPACTMVHAVRLPSPPAVLRPLHFIGAVQRRVPLELHHSGLCILLQSTTLRQDKSAQALFLPCLDGSLYMALELPYGFAHPLLRLEEVITSFYGLSMEVQLHGGSGGGDGAVPLQHVHHSRPYEMEHALQPISGVPQSRKLAAVFFDTIEEYFLLKEVLQHSGLNICEEERHILEGKWSVLRDAVETALFEEYGASMTAAVCATILRYV